MFLLFFILMLVTQHALGVDVIEGAESVVLPCEASPGKASSVTWTREDLNPKIVHFRIKIGQQPEKDDVSNQNQLFTSRTEVQPDALTTGNISLTLKHIQLEDKGTYSCDVRGGGRLTQTQVQLQVTSKKEVEQEKLRKQQEDLRKQKEEQARRQKNIWIAVGTIIFIILCIVAAVLGWLYHLGYIWQKVQQVEVHSRVESVLLRCRTIKLLPKDVRVKWTAEDRMVHESLTGSDQPGEQDKDYKGRTEMKMKRNLRILVDLSLTLKHPTLRDSKTYTCTVYSRDGDVLMKRQVKLEVKVPQVVYPGVESVLLPCEATDQLPEDVRVQWTDIDNMVHVSLNGSDQPGAQDDLYRGRTKMERQRPGDFSLTLKHPTVTDSKTYTCTVYSREGHVLMRRDVELYVREHQVMVVEEEEEEQVKQRVEPVELPFKTTELPGDVRVTWRRLDTMETVHVFQDGSDQQDQQDPSYRGRTEMKTKDLRQGDISLILKDPTWTDRGRYSCRVYSRGGDIRRETTVDLYISECLVEVKQGEEGAESIELPFKTTDLPADVRVTWRHLDPLKTVHVFQDGSDQQDQQDPSYRERTAMKTKDLRQGDVSLILKDPTERDEGLYICRLYSKEGDIRRETIVRLYITGRPVKKKKEESYPLL